MLRFPSVGAAHAFVNHFFDAHVRIPLHIHTDFEEDGRDTGILADGAVVFSTHAAVDQNLRHRVFGGGVFFLLPRLIERVDVVFQMVVADELEAHRKMLWIKSSCLMTVMIVFLFKVCGGK